MQRYASKTPAELYPHERGRVVMYEEAQAEIARLKAERDQAISALSKAAEARGRAEGKLEASELPGIVDGWKARAEKAEADLNEGKREADYLANVLWERHYKNKSPNFELLNTISGVVSQIDNMVAGIIADHDAAVAQVAGAYEAAAGISVTGEPEISRITQYAIRALTPVDAQKALDKMLTEAEQRGYANAMEAERKDVEGLLDDAYASGQERMRERSALSVRGMSDLSPIGKDYSRDHAIYEAEANIRALPITPRPDREGE